MARIVIRESDLTTPFIEGNSNEIVYVPGFATNESNYAGTIKDLGVPTLCTTVAEFNAYFGSIPAVFGSDQDYPEEFPESAKPTTGKMFKQYSVDPSYVYAKELIQAGIPVVYERLNSVNEEASVDVFYRRLGGENEYDPILNLENINDFNIKYITTGGYPSFEYGATLTATTEITKQDGSGIESVSCDNNLFISAIHQSAGLYNLIYIVPQNASASATTTGQNISNLVVSPGTFGAAATSGSGEYTFKASAVSTVDEQQVITWQLSYNGGDFAAVDNFDAYGITYTGTVAQNDTIVVTYVAADSPNWILNGEAINLADYGIIVSGTPVNGDIISINVQLNTSTSIVGKMLQIASSRGDCVAIIDHTDNPSRPLAASNSNSVYASVSGADSPYRISAGGEFAAMFTPWYKTTFVTSSKPGSNAMISVVDGNGNSGVISASTINWAPSSMPGSFAYLTSLAASVRNNPSWLAVAGVTRGVVPNLLVLDTDTKLTNAIADSYQSDVKISINPITNIRPYGYTIWGNRTLKNNAAATGLTATSFLNIRNMVSDIKKQAYSAAMSCIFEQNTDILWLNFKAQIEPILEQMTSGYGINEYKIIREQSNSPVKIVATIRIYPVYAVESFDITIELANDVVSVVE